MEVGRYLLRSTQLRDCGSKQSISLVLITQLIIMVSRIVNCNK